MKKLLFTIIILLFAFNVIQAQTTIELIDNKGNRNQTYPLVTETNPAIVEMINQVDTINLYNDIDWMQQYVLLRAQPFPTKLSVNSAQALFFSSPLLPVPVLSQAVQFVRLLKW